MVELKNENTQLKNNETKLINENIQRKLRFIMKVKLAYFKFE